MSDVDDVSRQLFELFRKIVPPPVEWATTHKKQPRPEDFVAAFERFNDQARVLRKKHRLGVLSRARVVLALQREMGAAGYPANLSRQVLFSLIVSAFIGKA